MAGHDAAADSFWRFSLMVYSRPGVADALLRLQDRAGHNVNLVLFAMWLGLIQRRRLDAADLSRATAAIADLSRDVVEPLRQLRRALKENPAADIRALRRRVLALEIDAERRVQARLAASIAGRKTRSSDGPRIAEANLRLVLGVDASSEEALILRGLP